MSFTKVQLRNKVMRVEGLLPIGQDADAEIVEIVNGVIDAAESFLESKGIAYWPSDEIPNGVVDAYRNYVAARAAPELPGSEVVTSEAQALRDLYEFTATKNGRVAFTYF